jgi:tRNA U38,U39,U40 pseudouridine synthase TruA
MHALLKKQNRTEAPPTFSASGLYLIGVEYDKKWGLPVTQRPICMA